MCIDKIGNFSYKDFSNKELIDFLKWQNLNYLYIEWLFDDFKYIDCDKERYFLMCENYNLLWIVRYNKEKITRDNKSYYEKILINHFSVIDKHYTAYEIYDNIINILIGNNKDKFIVNNFSLKNLLENIFYSCWWNKNEIIMWLYKKYSGLYKISIDLPKDYILINE